MIRALLASALATLVLAAACGTHTYGPTRANAEALNAGVVVAILDHTCVGFETYGVVGPFIEPC